MANQVAKEEGIENMCQFYEADATIDPDLLLTGAFQFWIVQSN
jgi:hypothetical protein